MSNYTKSTNFAIKDGLVTTDPAKVIKGTEIDNEYNAISNAIASKADVNSPALTGTPTVPTATLGTNTTQIASCAFAIANGIPSGCIVMWSGTIASIPSGWVLCNGSSGTPDLRDRFIIGASSDDSSVAKTNVTGALTKSGGSKDATLVAHTHTMNFNSSTASNNHTHNLSTNVDPGGVMFTQANNGSSLQAGFTGGYPVVQLSPTTTAAGADHVHAVNGTTHSSGSSATDANLPPYFALAFIMKS